MQVRIVVLENMPVHQHVQIVGNCRVDALSHQGLARLPLAAAEQVWRMSIFSVYRGALEILFLLEPIARSGQTSTHRWQPTQRLPSSTGLRSFPRRIA